MRFVYLEGGSGVSKPVPSNIVRGVRNVVDVPLIVGGGIKTGKQAKQVVSAGADIIVTGNVVESSDVAGKISELVEGVRQGVEVRS